MEGSKKRRVIPGRKPLSDRTNISPSVPLKANPSSAPAKLTTNFDDSPNPTSPSTPSLNTPSLPDLQGYEPISIVYSGRRSSTKRKQDKGKAVAVPVITSPNFNISHTRQKNDEFEGLNLPKAKAMTVPRTKKQRTLSSEKDAFRDRELQEYIEKQKAYFKEIDDFELQEEFASGDELD
ncbi:hypothetical protein VNO78_31675 [Psophocarpus tetragonolobus]|uniref:Sororin C-terminal region domain-containing protein n=1 Tax=Psophocarpus tetragonolobus TaxID=3891 RepID=A0AAN9RZH0_PSOTE